MRTFKMLKTAAGVDGTYDEGRTYEIPDELAEQFVAAGAAVALDATAPDADEDASDEDAPDEDATGGTPV